jgi:hypothetical protein
MKCKLFFIGLFFTSLSLNSFCQWNLDTLSGGKMMIKGLTEFSACIGITDNAGGTIQVYEKNIWEYAPGINSYSINVQRTDTTGQLLWGNADSGKILYQTFYDYEYLNLVSAKSDNAGGAYILFWGKTQQDPVQAFGFRLQHIDNNGNAQWPGYGVVLFETTDNFLSANDAKLNVDDAGNAFAVWRNINFAFGNLYAQKVNNAGTKLWGNSGLQVSLTGVQGEFLIAADNTGGLLAVFEDGRNSTYDPVNEEYDHLELFAQHISNAGQLAFGDNGLLAAGNVGDSMILVSENATTNLMLTDDNGGCYFVYGHFIGADGGEILLQRLSADGQKPWGNYGVLATGIAQGSGVYDYRLYKKPGGGVAGLYSLYEGSFYHLPLKLQHFNQDGITHFTEPITVAEASYATTSSATPMYDAVFYSDGAAAVAFLGNGDSLYVRMQQIAADGTLLYDINGKAMMMQVTDMVQIIPGPESFNNLVWQDIRNYPSFSQEKDAFITKISREISSARRIIYSVSNGNFNNPATWLNNIVPGSDDIVVISHNVIVTANTRCYSLSVQQSGNVVVATGVNFTILH